MQVDTIVQTSLRPPLWYLYYSLLCYMPLYHEHSFYAQRRVQVGRQYIKLVIQFALVYIHVPSSYHWYSN